MRGAAAAPSGKIGDQRGARRSRHRQSVPIGRMVNPQDEIGAGTQEIRRMLIGRELFEAAA